MLLLLLVKLVKKPIGCAIILCLETIFFTGFLTLLKVLFY